ncbi:MAG: peptidoglycan-binding protein LysM [Alphaproteobacteria bacterium]|nr:peptidoglycan-binding protein LysM [Alphaproteobacteria bacterium]
MGMFSFFKEVGEKLLGIGSAQAAAPADVEKALAAKVKELGLPGEELDIKFANGTVGGAAASQEAREKIILALGNTEGVGQVQDSIKVAAAAPEARFYTVQKGDNLSKIAKAHYGDANKYPQIFEANKPRLKHPDKIYPGQMLRIP